LEEQAVTGLALVSDIAMFCTLGYTCWCFIVQQWVNQQMKRQPVSEHSTHTYFRAEYNDDCMKILLKTFLYMVAVTMVFQEGELSAIATYAVILGGMYIQHQRFKTELHALNTYLQHSEHE